MKPYSARAIMNERREPPDSLDFFPTPPWGTRALVERVIPDIIHPRHIAWDPACGEGHMAYVLGQYFQKIHASDVFDYGYGALLDFLDPDTREDVDWIITNPPFSAAVPFTLKALELARVGVAMLCRSNWSAGQRRYESLFAKYPPAIEALFVERLPMHRGRWDPAGSTATDYSWFVWLRGWTGLCRKVWIPPGLRDALTEHEDLVRFGVQEPLPLLECQT